MEDGTVLDVRRRHLGETSLHADPDGQMVLDLRHRMLDKSATYSSGRYRFVGRDAVRVAAVVVPKVNRFGAAKQGVADAVAEIENAGGTEGYLERVARLSTAYTHAPHPMNGRRRRGLYRGQMSTTTGLFGLPKAHRLALEMALHEDTERRALNGELEELERAWRDAEEVAAISDNLLVPTSVQAKIDELR